jgi:hypothetical protein
MRHSSELLNPDHTRFFKVETVLFAKRVSAG